MLDEKFILHSRYQPAGDQQKAITNLCKGIEQDQKDLVLLGVTGSGKTYTMACVIEKMQCPALIIAHNKTLAAQLYEEMLEFFPDNAVEYFVSYYDYYQPEAYVPSSGAYIEKEAVINNKIERLRHSTTRSVLERRDVIVIASVSCIYGLGAPEFYFASKIELKVGDKINAEQIKRDLSGIQYVNSAINFVTGSFRMQGENLEIFPAHLESKAWRICLCFNEIEMIQEFDPLTGHVSEEYQNVCVYANSHYIVPRPTIAEAIEKIRSEMNERVEYYTQQNRFAEAQLIRDRVNTDIEMMRETGSCKGIENYSRYISGKNAGDPPPTLFDYLPNDALMFIDESHVTVPQISAMFKGNALRKQNLIEHGFRLPSALDNRPLSFEEWEKVGLISVYVSATLGKYELAKVKEITASQIIRPTGLLEPLCIVRPALGQVDDVIRESEKVIAAGGRVLITTVTKKTAEDLSEYMDEAGIKVAYIHSDVSALDRVELIYKLRKGELDVLVGVNLLREGLDIPECMAVAILDADKEGFLRSEISLIQTIGRAARHLDGYAILYADKITGSMQRALSIIEERRIIQKQYNEKHNITPRSVGRELAGVLYNFSCNNDEDKVDNVQLDCKGGKEKLYLEMIKCAENLEFEKATLLRNALIKDSKT